MVWSRSRLAFMALLVMCVERCVCRLPASQTHCVSKQYLRLHMSPCMPRLTLAWCTPAKCSQAKLGRTPHAPSLAPSCDNTAPLLLTAICVGNPAQPLINATALPLLLCPAPDTRCCWSYGGGKDGLDLISGLHMYCWLVGSYEWPKRMVDRVLHTCALFDPRAVACWYRTWTCGTGLVNCNTNKVPHLQHCLPSRLMQAAHGSLRYAVSTHSTPWQTYLAPNAHDALPRPGQQQLTSHHLVPLYPVQQLVISYYQPQPQSHFPFPYQRPPGPLHGGPPPGGLGADL